MNTISGGGHYYQCLRKRGSYEGYIRIQGSLKENKILTSKSGIIANPCKYERMFQKYVQPFCANFISIKYSIGRIFKIYILKHSLQRSISNHCFWQWKVLLVNYCKTDQSPYLLQEIKRITYNFSLEKLKKSNWNLRILRCWEQDTTVYEAVRDFFL